MTFTTRPELLGTTGMVASTHWLASGAGMAMLERGGNAFDAAVAAGLVLQVVEPHLNGPGGEAPIILRPAERDEVLVLAGQGPAPAAATIEAFRSLDLELVPGTGLLAACVPGAFDAWMRLLAEFGTMRLDDVLEPAISYAEHGYPLVPQIATRIATVEELFRREWTDSAAVYLPDGKPPAPGRRFRNPALARTYRRIVAEATGAARSREGEIEAAREAFYRGFVAAAIDEYVARAEVLDSSGRRNRGLLRGDDLDSYRVPLEPPVRFEYGGYVVCKTRPWGQGPVFLQQLSLLEGAGLEEMEPEGVEWVHAVVESAKLAFADREAWYGDPDVVYVPLDELLDREYAERRRLLIEERASTELRPGSPGGRAPALPRAVDAGALAAAAGVGEPTLPLARWVGQDTCHVDAVDRHGNAVSATPSGGWLHSSPVIPELGFCLGTRAQMFWLEEGLPNALSPRKRPRTTLSPSLALRDGECIAFGTPGGDQQDQWSLVFFLRLVHHGMNLQEAIDAPTFHSEHFPSSFYPRRASPGLVKLERRLAHVAPELRRRGHEVEVTDEWSLGRLSAAATRADGVLRAAANPREMQGYAVGR